MEALKSASVATLSIEVEDQYILFRSWGELLGLNLELNNIKGQLGVPEILNEDFLSACKIERDIYRIGLCTAIPPMDGAELMRIPYLGSGSVDINLVVNTTALVTQVELTTGIRDATQTEAVIIYPNPVLDKLYVQGLDGWALARIYDIHGRLLLTIPVDGPSAEIDIHELRRGVFLISLETGSGTVTRRFVKSEEF